MVPDATGEEPRAHELHLEIVPWFEAEVPVGSSLHPKIRVVCSEGCDLTGAHVALWNGSEPVASTSLASFDAGSNTSVELSLSAPSFAGDHAWSLVVSTDDGDHPGHSTCSLSLPFRTRAHRTAVQVWDVASPVTIGQRVAVNIGAKCLDGCGLGGVQVEILDAAGQRSAFTRLNDTTWPGSGLFWTEVGFLAPDTEGVFSWQARLRIEDLDLPHGPASFTFGFATVPPANHRLTVEVVEDGSASPVADAHVCVGRYRAATDSSGRAAIPLAEGSYELSIWKVGYEVPTRAIEISTDLTVRLEAVVLPDRSSWEND